MPDFDKKNLELLTEVLPNVAAQLRASMANVYACANRLATPEAREKDPALDKNAAILNLSCHRMLRIVGNLSAASLLASDRRLELENEDVIGLCRDLCSKVSALFELQGVALTFRADTASHIIALNTEMAERMLLNLLSNALKFTRAGGKVEVHVRVTKSQVLLSVSDTGCGISEDRLETVFDRFLDTDRLDPTPHGLGLGLPLCRRIARGHGGTIVAESKLGVGSTFTVALPNRKEENPTLHDAARFDYAGGFNRVLMELSDALGSEAFLQKYTD